MTELNPSTEWLLREAELESRSTVMISAGAREQPSRRDSAEEKESNDDLPLVKSLIGKHGKSKLIDMIQAIDA